MSQQMSDRELNRLLDEFLDRLTAALPPLTDAQAFEALSADEATRTFAESIPCWMGDSNGN